MKGEEKKARFLSYVTPERIEAMLRENPELFQVHPKPSRLWAAAVAAAFIAGIALGFLLGRVS